LYTGVVRHARLASDSATAASPAHAFTYGVCMALLDVSDAPALPRALAPLRPLLSAGGGGWPAPLSFNEAAHQRDRLPGSSLGAAVRRAVAAALGGAPPRGRVLLLTNLAQWGYVFNPVSIFYVLDEGAEEEEESAAVAAAAASPPRVAAILLEVTNTPWGEQHSYVLAPGAAGVAAMTKPAHEPPSERPDWLDAAWRELAPAMPRARSGATAGAYWLRYVWRKAFHVSPFMPMGHAYDWILSAPGARLAVFGRNLLLDGGGGGGGGGAGGGLCPALPTRSGGGAAAPPSPHGACVFTASLQLERVPGAVTRWTLLWLLFVAAPLLTLRVQLWIHVEAARLFTKGALLHPHPTGSENGFTRAVAAAVQLIAVPVMAVAAMLPPACRSSRSRPAVAAAAAAAAAAAPAAPASVEATLPARAKHLRPPSPRRLRASSRSEPRSSR